MGKGMEGTSVKAHKDSNTLIIPRYTNYTKPISHRVNLMVGMNARFMERINISGDLELGKGAQVTGNVKAKNVILGPWSVVRGDLTVNGDLVALDHSKVTGAVRCSGSATIRPGVAFGSLDAAGLVEVFGKKPAKHTVGKMVTKKEDK